MPGVLFLITEQSQTYLAPGNYSFVIPNTTRLLRAWIQAAGGSGKGRSSPPVDGSAGGGGGFSYIERNVIDTEWGNTISLTVGAGSAGNNGGNSTLSGTVGGSAISVTANGGNKGTVLADGTGGTASGGDTNVSGEDGFGYVTTPGEEAPGTPGRGGGYNYVDAFNYDFRGPGEGGFAASTDQPGYDGGIILRWL